MESIGKLITITTYSPYVHISIEKCEHCEQHHKWIYDSHFVNCQAMFQKATSQKDSRRKPPSETTASAPKTRKNTSQSSGGTSCSPFHFGKPSGLIAPTCFPMPTLSRACATCGHRTREPCHIRRRGKTSADRIRE